MRRQPWPERAGEAQCLGGCLGKPGDCASSPTLLLYACRSRESISSIFRLPREGAARAQGFEASIFAERCGIVTASLVQPWQHRGRWFPQGIKRERGACARAHHAAAAPATVGGESAAKLATGSLFAPGKAAVDSDPRARTSATGNGHARARRAGCPGGNVESGCFAFLSRATTDRSGRNRGDGIRARHWGVSCFPSSAVAAAAGAAQRAFFSLLWRSWRPPLRPRRLPQARARAEPSA